MPVALIIDVALLAMVMGVTVRFIVRVPSLVWACVVPMVRMPRILRAVNVNVRNLISRMTVPERATSLSWELRVQQ
jgi:hypothetical protein